MKSEKTNEAGQARTVSDNIGHFWTRTDNVINTVLWMLFPVINVDRVKDIPADYPGAMGVPITFLDKWNKDQFELLDCISPKTGEKECYKRVIIRNLHPDLPEWIDFTEWLQKTGSQWELGLLEKTVESEENGNE